jgi:hypothetical protein
METLPLYNPLILKKTTIVKLTKPGKAGLGKDYPTGGDTPGVPGPSLGPSLLSSLFTIGF